MIVHIENNTGKSVWMKTDFDNLLVLDRTVQSFNFGENDRPYVQITPFKDRTLKSFHEMYAEDVKPIP